jgi:hypothetical protein
MTDTQESIQVNESLAPFNPNKKYFDDSNQVKIDSNTLHL